MTEEYDDDGEIIYAKVLFSYIYIFLLAFSSSSASWSRSVTETNGEPFVLFSLKTQRWMDGTQLMTIIMIATGI
jgi:hypothetical protein